MNKNNKRGVSELIGYVLLIVFTIVLAAIVYQWLKTYVPKEDLACPSDVSVLVKDYNCTGGELNLVLKNNGKFSFGGYLIYATNNPEAELATIDISKNITSGETPMQPTGIKLNGEGNSFIPNSEETHTFDISGVTPLVYSIEIVPMRWQEQGRKNRLVTCKESKMRKSLTCS
jgi:flagellin-like protein